MKRRTFLKLAGIGTLSVAAGCTNDPEKHLYSLVQAPDDMVTGKPAWYATTCRECPAGCGVIAKTRENRVIKLEGNPLHPLNQGALCLRGQAALQGVYHPDRLKTPLLKEGKSFKAISFEQALELLKAKTAAAAAKGPGRVRMITETVGGTLLSLFTQALARWNASPPLVYEQLACDGLKDANRLAFGVEGLPVYRLENADFLLGLGGDFLGTWLAPVAYARAFKAMHAVHDAGKGGFWQVSAYQNLTGANADAWLACRPGSEAALALALLAAVLQKGRGEHLPEPVRRAVAQTALDPDTLSKWTGLSRDVVATLTTRLLASGKPLVLGPGVGGDVAAHLAANLLNWALDPTLARVDLAARHRVEIASGPAAAASFFQAVAKGAVDVVLIHQTNPVFSLAPGTGVREALERPEAFSVSFTAFMDETAALADLVFPIRLPLESVDEYDGRRGTVSLLQPVTGALTAAPAVGDVILAAAFGHDAPGPDYQSLVVAHLRRQGLVRSPNDWLKALANGGVFAASEETLVDPKAPADLAQQITRVFGVLQPPPAAGHMLVAAPSLRFFDGRGANRPWLAEHPDPITQVAWQNPALVHPATAAKAGWAEGDMIRLSAGGAGLEAPVVHCPGVFGDAIVMEMGLGHQAGRYATGVNPLALLPAAIDPAGGSGFVTPVTVAVAGARAKLARVAGSASQHGRPIAVSMALTDIGKPKPAPGLTMDSFPLTLPIPEGYDPRRDIYPAHDHDTYRWAMVVDLDRCTGCGACAVACYAENNIGIVGADQIVRGREMAWLQIQRYIDDTDKTKVTFLPMMCQHCDNAPCESVCPVYAPHHSKEGLNNQIYNRCIGTRFCGQNCPYKVRRFNWFTWDFPEPLNLQLNPNVTVRAKGVMEKCSFCIQRIKDAHGVAKDENRPIRDGEVIPACAQTCPTGALVFGNLMDPQSRVSRLAADARAYQVLGYLNTKPAVIYLKKVLSVKI